SFRLPKTETVLRGNASRSYSPPTPQDLYFPGFSNPNLKSENATCWEVGLDQPLLDKQLTLSGTWFHNKIDNLIQFDFITFKPQNIAKATAEGVELSAKYEPCKWFNTTLGYTYLTAMDDTAHLRLS